MKKFIYIVLMGLILSCTDLDLRPEYGDTGNIAFQDVNNLERYLAKIYASYSLTGQQGPAGDADLALVNDEGFTSYIRAYWKAQELTTDEAVIAWQDAGIQDLNTHTWSSDNQFVKVLYYRLFLIISYSNDFLEQSTDDLLAEYGYNEEEFALAQAYRSEVRFLRAMAYWHALDLFRNIPLVTQITADFPVQTSPQNIFDFIESELQAIENELPDPQQNEYGRADKAAVWMMQAKLYLNGEVYTGNSYYTQAITALEKILDGPYTIEDDYQLNFRADNHTSNELIFTLPADGIQTQSYGGATFLINGAIGGNMVASNYGTSGAWAGLRTTKNLVQKFPDETGDIDSRAIFFTDGQSLEIADLTVFTEGYAVPKYTNLTTEGEPGSNIEFADTDYPLFRLADVYLMYAEAVLRGGGGSEATAVNLINELRERAYGDNSGNITIADLTLDFILDERARELYWEGHRRVDLIRFGVYTGGEYLWPWKGNNIDGASISEHLEIFPIPATDLAANLELEQNNGY
ncbi:RagB/SusD family nutrient uptake outer membrane protein [Marivirga sp.]|uniref:RagB/SusD family nutrient uptake outer membrane protein n=1 Tax=Marivirga sp. TaxID=2018662 RepID=UPI002D7F69A6|nr:RagB/SusD family nutrient uptake outer membrane protein [Marivirga sp.]HET8858982.1 RagB/SusD family nutrient uptake outer membrane protein [Marivirga sp.]